MSFCGVYHEKRGKGTAIKKKCKITLHFFFIVVVNSANTFTMLRAAKEAFKPCEHTKYMVLQY